MSSTTETTETSLDPTNQLAIHLYVLTNAVRAILATHPQADQARQIFLSLTAQMQCHPPFLTDPASSAALRQMAEALLQPPASLQTPPEHQP